MRQSGHGRRALRARRDPPTAIATLSGAVALTVTTDPLRYYAAHKCALFPIPAGSKSPIGIVQSFKHDHSTDPAQWDAWRAAHPGCNFGIVAFASRLIIVDIDTSGDRDEAWALWCELCATWQIPVAAPHVQSARGGWHVYFAVPESVDAAKLRQPDAIKKRINVRCVGFTVAAGSHFEGLPYTLLSDAPPYPAPAALVEHCTRRPADPARIAAPVGARDAGDVAALLNWLNERGAFAAYEDWVSVGMALKLEFADAGADLWALCHDETVTPDTAASKWESFSAEPDANSVTLNTFMAKAHSLGWKGSVRKSASAMFDNVAAIAAAAGASLSSGSMPMLAGQEELCRLATPILTEFLDATTDAPATPAAVDLPGLPASMSGHGLFSLMSDSLSRVFCLADTPKFKATRVIDPLAVLYVMHPDVYDAVVRRFRAVGISLPESRIKLNAANLTEKIERVTVTLDKWEYDRNGEPQADNSDNVKVLLGVLGLDIRWNAWLERMEISGGLDPDLRWTRWTYVDDAIVAKLRTRANRTKTRFRPGKEFLWESLLALAHQAAVDPVLDRLSQLATEWDGVPRLNTWLSIYCGVPCDSYSQAVSRAIIGGMVLRARYPGCKFDLMPVFYGRQGTGKSTLAAILADMGQTPLHEILAGNGKWFTDTVQLGDEAKELVLSLAGKLVAEIGEMGMRGNTNASHVKAMISRQVDAGRTAYARAVTERPRRNIFFGTTNDEHPLTDPSGNRRFLPVPVNGEIDLAGVHRDIGQIIGEAAAQEAQGRTFDLPREVWGIAAERQEAARAVGDLEVLFEEWFAPTEFTRVAYVTVADLVRLCDATGRKNTGQVVGKIMDRLGFVLAAPWIDGRRTKVWTRGAENVRPKDIPALCRYHVDTSQGTPRVIARGQVPQMPSTRST